MRPRLGFAQEVVRCVEGLNYVCPVAIQPHQLLLQDFGDIEIVEKLVVISPDDENKHVAPLKNGVKVLLDAYVPKRRWQYVAIEEEEEAELEDALIQRCLLEYGERITVIVNEDNEPTMEIREDKGKNQVDFMAQIASQVAAIASGGTSKPRGVSIRGLRRLTKNDPQAADFDRQFQKAKKQATKMQQDLLSQRREREGELLQRVVSAPEEKKDNTEGRAGSSVQSLLHLARAQLKDHELHVQQLIEEKTELNGKMKDCHARATALDEALFAVKQEMEEVEAQTPKDATTQEHLVKLQQLMKKNEELKHEKKELRAKCRLELETLKERIEKLKLHVAQDANSQDEEALRLNEIEHMHAQVAQKHKEMKVEAAKQTRAVHLKMKQIDEIPTRIELVQYERRFVELCDEVALTLDETRKYYCVYNTIKTTLEFLEKEISLINSISENFDTAMSSKTATQAFFMQIENIIQSVQGTVAKQKTARDGHKFSVETLESKYQLLLEQERTYVNAIREFQKECEKNEKLLVRLEERAQH
ncbi:unnamed protein product [Peronospora destructor]|uniref:CCDC93 coiled-coil domain-containing protein n=1 Tax=Peronospora destructor TaxID=86335 RepID=A0AAV0U537_9STRA|nr:unnamed protein product [Peronospora destructor]